MKIVKAELEDELHLSFKVWSYQNGVTMAQALVSLIEVAVSKPVCLVRTPANPKDEVPTANPEHIKQNK